jgi:large subunit ribosomal protein L28
MTLLMLAAVSGPCSARMGDMTAMMAPPARTATGLCYASGRSRRYLVAYRCEVCGKEPWVGKQVSFSHKRSSRRWLPNIQRVRVRHGSNSKRIRVCTSCIKAGKVEKV